MKRRLAGLPAALALGAQAQDALRGKRPYFNAGRVVGSRVTCADCHGRLQSGALGTSKGTDAPDVIERAVAAITAMAPFHTRLREQDYADLAALV